MFKRGILMMLSAFVLCQTVYAAEKPKTYGEKLCSYFLQYNCHNVSKIVITDTQKKPKEVTETWEMLFPDLETRDLIQRINRRNTKLRLDDNVAIPIFLKDKSRLDFSPFSRSICYYDLKNEICYPPKNESIYSEYYSEWQGHFSFCSQGKTIIFDPKLLAFAAYDEYGRLAHWGPAVGGKNYCPDAKKPCLTPAGEYKIAYKVGANYRSKTYPLGCTGEKCALIPYAMFFEDGAAFHASNFLSGENASHGCVRLFPSDAKWLNLKFAEIGTKVLIRPY